MPEAELDQQAHSGSGYRPPSLPPGWPASSAGGTSRTTTSHLTVVITVEAPLGVPMELFGWDRPGGLDGATQSTVGSELPEHVDLRGDDAALT
ncbi:hypothetical protein GCM10009780_06920 [Actinomadura alba]